MFFSHVEALFLDRALQSCFARCLLEAISENSGCFTKIFLRVKTLRIFIIKEGKLESLLREFAAGIDVQFFLNLVSGRRSDS